MSRTGNTTDFLAGLQWLFFMFANTVVIPLTIGEAFDLSSMEVASALQRSFIFTGAACMLQVLFGHKYPLMEGHSGIWWGAILSLAASASSAGMTTAEVGGGLAVGIILSGVLTAVLGALGMGDVLKKLFKPVVMSTVLFLLASQLIAIFSKGMLGLSTGEQIDLPTAGLSFVIILLVAWITIKGPASIRNFAILIGIVFGWIVYALLFPAAPTEESQPTQLVNLFPWGKPSFSLGLIMMAVVTGLVNTTNTMASIKGIEPLINKKTTQKQYKSSFVVTGLSSVVAGLFGLVPYGPYISSLGFLQSTQIYRRLPLIIGSTLFILLGLIPTLGQFFSTLPVSVGNAVLFVAYLQLFSGALTNLSDITFTSKTIYRISAPVLLGIAIMNIPSETFSSLPVLIRPLLSNGLLVGIILAIILENVVDWSKFAGTEASKGEV
ncbi:uracil/xanthine transporter [Peribacillus psychrosaccharolyticus]|uniref:Uracil/xanthine transporter n=1 Tax=Peribacillus psychrosaccharolyticus TaxID=1407 RepID=A0A974S0Q6_PERPY|nr:uracil/xanthine transporter [Peribacillus psychrosaccharolyticus]MEC2056073.1 uracil/xanthine transporter [Peribacillus psychrosaccharolyticus]MED3745514.1 uracil/xanthine transporter [Peribacillus psychrosaccharolyticus]QQT00731.1 uracil/xanthine transporter [Peribacillus psychrosaccharolyticus]